MSIYEERADRLWRLAQEFSGRYVVEMKHYPPIADMERFYVTVSEPGVWQVAVQYNERRPDGSMGSSWGQGQREDTPEQAEVIRVLDRMRVIANSSPKPLDRSRD